MVLSCFLNFILNCREYIYCLEILMRLVIENGIRCNVCVCLCVCVCVCVCILLDDLWVGQLEGKVSGFRDDLRKSL